MDPRLSKTFLDTWILQSSNPDKFLEFETLKTLELWIRGSAEFLCTS